MANINDKIREFEQMPGAVLLDVRRKDEYAAGHIPGSINLPLQEIEDIERTVTDKETPLFVYCLSGIRSGQAVSALKNHGYTKAQNIGGIRSYGGPVEK